MAPWDWIWPPGQRRRRQSPVACRLLLKFWFFEVQLDQQFGGWLALYSPRSTLWQPRSTGPAQPHARRQLLESGTSRLPSLTSLRVNHELVPRMWLT